MLTVLALLCLFFSANFASVFFAETPETDEFGEALGIGLSKAFAVVFMIFSVIATDVFALVGGILSFVNRKTENKVFRILFIVYAVLNLLALLTATGLFISVLITGQG